MPELIFHGLRASYRTWGSGADVALLHAGGSSGAQWTEIAGTLSAAYRLIAPDLLGMGVTEPWPVKGGLTHDLQADLVAAVQQAEGAAPAHIIGHSYGGATAVRLALRYPGLVRSLLLFEPVITPLLREVGDPLWEAATRIGRVFVESVEAGQPERGWEAFIDARNRSGTWSAMADQRKARFLANSAQIVEGFLSNWNNPTRLTDCRSLRMATTIVCSEQAIPEDRRLTAILHEAIPGSRYVTLAGVGHMAPLTHPDVVTRVIDEHLAKISRDRPPAEAESRHADVSSR